MKKVKKNLVHPAQIYRVFALFPRGNPFSKFWAFGNAVNALKTEVFNKLIPEGIILDT